MIKRIFLKGLGVKNLIKNLNATFNPNQVGYVIFYVTNRCNFRCEFCFYYAEIEKGRKPEQLTLSEIDKVSKSVGSLLQLSLTGGEPFLRKDFAEVTEIWLRNTGAKYITIPTNASLKEKMLNYLHYILPRFPSHYFRLAFSIDGIGDQHDANRSKPGSYARIVDAYNAISPLRQQYNNLVLDSNTVFTSNTENNIIEIVRHIDENFQFDNITVTYARGEIKDENLKTEAEETYRSLNKFLGSLQRRKEKRLGYPIYRAVRDVAWQNLMTTTFEDTFVTPCVAGKKLIVISETGIVSPCELLDKPLGSLREHDFDLKKLMAKDESKSVAKWIVDTKCKCSFECAHAANVAWNKSEWRKIIKNIGKNIGDTNRPYGSVSKG